MGETSYTGGHAWRITALAIWYKWNQWSPARLCDLQQKGLNSEVITRWTKLVICLCNMSTLLKSAKPRRHSAHWKYDGNVIVKSSHRVTTSPARAWPLPSQTARLKMQCSSVLCRQRETERVVTCISLLQQLSGFTARLIQLITSLPLSSNIAV